MFGAFREVVDYHVTELTTFVMVLAACLGSVLWWFVVTAVTSYWHQTIEQGTLKRMNQASGGFIFLTGATLLGYAIRHNLVG
jgi:hypothetical protein